MLLSVLQLIKCSLGFFIFPRFPSEGVSFLLQLDWWECNNEVKKERNTFLHSVGVVILNHIWQKLFLLWLLLASMAELDIFIFSESIWFQVNTVFLASKYKPSGHLYLLLTGYLLRKIKCESLKTVILQFFQQILPNWSKMLINVNAGTVVRLLLFLCVLSGAGYGKIRQNALY